jgi:hypothetical protein
MATTNFNPYTALQTLESSEKYNIDILEDSGLLDAVIDNSNNNANYNKKNNHNYCGKLCTNSSLSKGANIKSGILCKYKDSYNKRINNDTTNNKDINATGNSNTITDKIVIDITSNNNGTSNNNFNNINSTIKFKIQPVNTCHRDDWSKLAYLIKINFIEISGARNWNHKIRIYTPSEQDYKRLTSLLALENFEYYTYRLFSEMNLRLFFEVFLLR